MGNRFYPLVKTIMGHVVSGGRAQPVPQTVPAYLKAYETLVPKYQFPFGVAVTEFDGIRWAQARRKHVVIYRKRVFHNDGNWHDELFLWVYENGQMVELLQDGVHGPRRRFMGFVRRRS